MIVEPMALLVIAIFAAVIFLLRRKSRKKKERIAMAAGKCTACDGRGWVPKFAPKARGGSVQLAGQIGKTHQQPCPQCNGKGVIRGLGAVCALIIFL